MNRVEFKERLISLGFKIEAADCGTDQFSIFGPLGSNSYGTYDAYWPEDDQISTYLTREEYFGVLTARLRARNIGEETHGSEEKDIEKEGDQNSSGSEDDGDGS